MWRLFIAGENSGKTGNKVPVTSQPLNTIAVKQPGKIVLEISDFESICDLLGEIKRLSLTDGMKSGKSYRFPTKSRRGVGVDMCEIIVRIQYLIIKFSCYP